MNVYLFNLQEVREKVPTHHIRGVYMMLDNKNNPLYVGQSVYLKARIMSHFKGNTNTNKHSKEFEKVIIVVAKDYLNIIEGTLINLYNPKYNTHKLKYAYDWFERVNEMEETLIKINRLLNKNEQISLAIWL